MSLDVFKAALPYLAVLFFIMTNAILSVLAVMRQREISLHDRVREAKLLRQDYLETLEKQVNVEVEADIQA